MISGPGKQLLTHLQRYELKTVTEIVFGTFLLFSNLLFSMESQEIIFIVFQFEGKNIRLLNIDKRLLSMVQPLAFKQST